MDELEAGERALLDALRDADEPTDDDRRRMRAAVWARVGLAGTAAAAVTASATSAAGAGAAGHAVGPAAASVTASASTAVAKGAAVTLLGAPLKIGLATLVVGLATGAALYFPFPAPGDAPEAPRALEAARIADQVPRTPHAAAPSGAPSDTAPPPAEAGASAEADAAAEANEPARAAASAEASAPASAPASAEASAPARAGASAVRASAAPAAGSATRAPASRPPPPGAGAAAGPGSEGLDAEIALLRDAQQALQAGQFAQALAKLNEHASRYPRGVLSTEREASRAIALCRSGRAASGRAIAARLLARSPGSPLATRVRAACGQEE
ncbi:hypothetical protein WMF04_08730 [Sorangium sp. So ce260]|uniref:hypothetical protein n=1 Tax=Sorangium sp. So ce260 TaxID=3133291 RepID=UPI003F60E45B